MRPPLNPPLTNVSFTTKSWICTCVLNNDGHYPNHNIWYFIFTKLIIRASVISDMYWSYIWIWGRAMDDIYFVLSRGPSSTLLAKKVVTPPLKTIKPMWIELLCFHLAEIGMIWTRDCSPTKSDTTLGRHSMQGQVGSSSSETPV